MSIARTRLNGWVSVGFMAKGGEANLIFGTEIALTQFLIDANHMTGKG